MISINGCILPITLKDTYLLYSLTKNCEVRENGSLIYFSRNKFLVDLLELDLCREKECHLERRVEKKKRNFAQ